MMGKLKNTNSKASVKSKANQSQVVDAKGQTKISSYFKKTEGAQVSAVHKKPENLLVPDLKKYAAKYTLKAINKTSVSVAKDSSVSSHSSAASNKTAPVYLDTSDEDIIELTPEVYKKKEVRLGNLTDIQVFSFANNDDSFDCIPATPFCPTKTVSICNDFSDSLCIEVLKRNEVGEKPSLINNSVSESYSCYKRISKLKFQHCLKGKRLAECGTGISPDAKKSYDEADNVVIDAANLSCKTNLFNNIENSVIADSSAASENDPSFSLLQTGLKEFKSPERENGMSVTSEKKLEPTAHLCPNFSDHPLDSDSTKFVTEILQMKSEETRAEGNITESVTNKKNDYNTLSDDQLFTEMLSIDFDNFSPFKDPKKHEQSGQSACKIACRNLSKTFSEAVGQSSFAGRGNYGRHIILSIERDLYQREILLQLKCSLTGLLRKCKLTGFWFESTLREGDIVHILMPDEIDDMIVVSNEKGIIVINPDFLVSGTSVVSGVFCQRKAVLNEKFKGYEGGNKIMLIGKVVHQLFQEAVQLPELTEEKLQAIIERIVHNSHVLRELYAINIPEEEIKEVAKSFISSIMSWRKMYFNEGTDESDCSYSGKDWYDQVKSVEDIEENIWCPKFGIKGKIDLTVRTSRSKKVMPLELKTGKPSFSAEHKGQVTLYSMMSCDRREDPEAGLLLYLKDGAMCEVPAGEKEKKGLIQLRNEIVSFLTAVPDIDENHLGLPSLPEPLYNERLCSRCPHLLTCSSLQKVTDTVPEAPHPMSRLVPQTVQHLSEKHLEYFRKWYLLLHLEIEACSKAASIRALWCMDSAQREVVGDCLGDMLLWEDSEVQRRNSTCFIHKFIRHPSNPSKLPIVFQTGEGIVVSSTTEIALSLGIVQFMDENCVTVVLDRDLKLSRKWKEKVFRIDRCEYQYTMSSFFTNLSLLMEDSRRSERLRRLIIDREKPQRTEGVERDIVPRIRSILKHLNKDQQRAVLRCLLAKDYSILKGFPGTGKSSTIVGLVRILNCLRKSVLITSYTHSAVDNILLKLKAHRDVRILRLGKITRIHPDILEFADENLTQDMTSVNELRAFYNSYNAVATICLGMNHILFTQNTFDYCIMDEASQVMQAASLGPLFFSDRFILVGDSLQLPPVVKSSTAKSLGMMESLLEHLDSEGASVSLYQQYRMNEPIMKLANMLTYDGQLMCASEELKTATLPLPLFNVERENGTPIWLLKCGSPKLEDAVLFVDTFVEAPEVKDSANQPTNPNEAKIIVAIINWLMSCGLSADEIGVITPYRAQVKLLKDKTAHFGHSGSILEVNTVDQYQGRDKDVIIYSCVRSGLSQNDVRKGEILQDVRRLNVAITRAKVKLIVLGDMKTLQLFEPFRKLLSVIEDPYRYTIQQGKDGFDWAKL